MSNLNDANSVWNQLVNQMNKNPNISDYAMMNGFLTALKPQILSEGSLILSTDNKWAKGYIDSKYKKTLEAELKTIVGNDCEIIIVISDFQEENENRVEVTSQETDRKNLQLDVNKEESEDKNVKIADDDGCSLLESKQEEIIFDNFHNGENQQNEEAAQNHEQNGTLNPNIIVKNAGAPIQNQTQITTGKTFETFVVADTNSYAYGAAYSVAENPGEINNPLFIYGRSGLGKTHLLLAIQDYVNKNYIDKIVYYAPATNLIEDYVYCLGTKNWADFNRKYRGADILLLDDVQYLEGAEETTNEFFKIFNEMISNNKHIVLSADRAPKDINLDERLQSRFANGVTADIQAPKFETKLKIFQNHIEHLKVINKRPDLEIPNDVVNRVVELSNSNIRNLEGAAASLVVYILYGREDKTEPITVEEAEEITSKIFFTKLKEKVTISDIQRFVESYYKISHGEMIGSQRPRNISQARQVAMYLSRTLTQASYPEIGRAFKKDHSSVVHAYKNIEKKRQTDRDFCNELERISDMIIASVED